jgi:hypothetical protein
MPNSIAQPVGVDIAKGTLDAHLHPAGRSRRFANDAQGMGRPDRLARRLRDRAGRVRAQRRLSPRLRAPPGRGRSAPGQGQSPPGAALRRGGRPARQDRCGRRRHARPLRGPPRAAAAAWRQCCPRCAEGAARRPPRLVKSRVATRNRDHTDRSALQASGQAAPPPDRAPDRRESTPPCTRTSPSILP